MRGGTWDSDFPDGVLAGYALSLETIFTVQRDDNFTRELQRYILTLPPAYHYIGFLGYSSHPDLPVITGHVVGIDTYLCKFFDPNAGEANFLGDRASLANFTRVWLNMAYQITSPSVMLRRYVPAIAPPPALNFRYR